MENQDKLIALFKCIRELCGLKYKLITDIDKQVWHKFVDEIPDDKENITINFPNNINSDLNSEYELDAENTVFLKVSKPEFSPCPLLPQSVVGWIKESYIKYTNEIEILDFDEVLDENFDDSKKRIKDFDIWKETRDKWVQDQIRIDKTRSFFTELYLNYISLDKESETIELMVGDGLLTENPRESIYHPVLLKRLKMEFDSENNVISIVDTDVESELYTVLLQDIDYINHDAINKLKEQITNNFLHPLDRKETPVFLKKLLHMLCSNSKFMDDGITQINEDDKLIMSLKPVFFIKKRDGGVFKAIDDIISDIEEDGIGNGPLLDIVGGKKMDENKSEHDSDLLSDLSSLNGEDKDILLCKEANQEQLEIAKRIENYNAVLVQGPPGTGKTHTIANLMGHFLSQGKSVLVTSHTKKALNVLIDKIPVGLQNLCVSLLDDTNKDMERSIDGISEIISGHSTLELTETVSKLTLERNKILNELTETRNKITSIKFKEYQSIVLDSKGYSVTEAATFVNQFAQELSYIPGSVKLYKSLPVSQGELDTLYQTNELINSFEEIELKLDLPSTDLILTPFDFKNCIFKISEFKERICEISEQLSSNCELNLENKHIAVNKKNLINNLNSIELENLKSLVTNMDVIDDWLIKTILDGIRGGGFKDVWNQLLAKIEDTSNYAANSIGTVIGKKIFVDENINIAELKDTLNNLSDHFEKGKKISKLDLFFHKTWGEVLEKTSINDVKISSKEDCSVILNYIILQEKRKSLGILWEELVFKSGGPSYTEFGTEPERICLKRYDKIKKHLYWYENVISPMTKSLELAGINKEAVFPIVEYNTELDELKDKINILTKILPLYIEAIEIIYIKNNEITKQLNNTKLVLESAKLKGSDVCFKLIQSLLEENVEEYEMNYRIYKTLYIKYHYLNERKRILNKIKEFAPDWAVNIENRIGIHGEKEVPDHVEGAWKWKQLSGIISEIISEPYEQLLKKSVELNLELKDKTAKLAEAKGWYQLLSRVENDIEKQQALKGWKLTVRKIGKKTKNGPRLLKQAKELMSKCQTAVPAWVMTINKALESLDPKTNKFDVLIIDEASQSDISALPIIYLAKKIIIVGDNEQVSPLAVGVDQDKVIAVQDMYIKGISPIYHLFDLKTSIYDIASTTFSSIMLKEHFRSVPDIIGYSNKLSYNHKIRPLRDESSSNLKPTTIAFRVDGSRERKINKVESENIVALMMACMEQPEYDGKTFGAISLLGDEQAKLINETAIQKMNLKNYEQRAIMCGNASQFQGDERDVIFISLVDNKEGEGPLRLTGEGADKSTKQRYNVAISRARDQLWVVHSLDIYNDLKNGDMRRDLLEYVNNPKAFNQLIENSDKQAESEFEKQVCRKLIAKGYNIKQQWEVGSYRIDIVAISGEKKIAIECDGDCYHSGEDKIIEDMKRQAILERLGWKFIRIRGSEYFCYPDHTMKKVYSQLDSYEIYPESFIDLVEEKENTTNNDLFNRVKIRASQIIEEWNNN